MAFAGNFDILHDLLLDPDTDDESCIHEAVDKEVAMSGNEINSVNSHSSTTASCIPTPPIPEPHISSEIDGADVIPSRTYTSGISDVRNYIMSKRNENTVKKTEGCIKRFQEWIQAPPRSDTRDVLQILPFELDTYIGGFLLSLQKNDGSNYEPDTLTSFHRGIDRYLRENGYNFNILTSDLFSTSRQVLQSRRKELKQKGLGNRPNKAQPISENEEEKLWECGQLGHDNPHALLNTVWFNNTKLLGFRGCDENRQLKWGDIKLKMDENGSEYLEFNERTTKTRGGNSTHLRSFNPKQFENPENKSRCPIEAYKLYAKHRPQAMDTPESPFYIAVNQNSTGEKWFKNQPVGRNKLGVMMKTMAINADLTASNAWEMERNPLYPDAPYYENYHLPPYPVLLANGVETQMEEVLNFDSRDTDVILVTFPESGTNWLRDILYMLSKGRLEYDQVNGISTLIDMANLEKINESNELPRLLSSHLPFRHLPKKHTENGYKIIYVCRNPKDVTVSMYNHLKKCKFLASETFPGTWTNFLENVMEKNMDMYGNWFDHAKDWEEAVSTGKCKNICITTFEDLKSNPVAEIRRMSNFLGHHYQDDFLEEVAKMCTFENVVEATKTSAKHIKDMMTISVDGSDIVRRTGQVGNWKKWLTVDQNERFDKLIQREMKDSKINIKFEI